jgi:hypothetical protein
MKKETDFFPILRKMILPQEIFLGPSDTISHSEFQQKARENPHLYIWFNETINSLCATFEQPQSLTITITKIGWHTKGNTLQFGETPLEMIGTNQDILITVFKKESIVDAKSHGLNHRFLKRLKEIHTDFFISKEKHS